MGYHIELKISEHKLTSEDIEKFNEMYLSLKEHISESSYNGISEFIIKQDENKFSDCYYRYGGNGVILKDFIVFLTKLSVTFPDLTFNVCETTFEYFLTKNIIIKNGCGYVDIDKEFEDVDEYIPFTKKEKEENLLTIKREMSIWLMSYDLDEDKYDWFNKEFWNPNIKNDVHPFFLLTLHYHIRSRCNVDDFRLRDYKEHYELEKRYMSDPNYKGVELDVDGNIIDETGESLHLLNYEEKCEYYDYHFDKYYDKNYYVAEKDKDIKYYHYMHIKV